MEVLKHIPTTTTSLFILGTLSLDEQQVVGFLPSDGLLTWKAPGDSLLAPRQGLCCSCLKLSGALLYVRLV